MAVVLDPDAVAVYKAFQEAGRPAYETLTLPEAREYYMQGRSSRASSWFTPRPIFPESIRRTANPKPRSY